MATTAAEQPEALFVDTNVLVYANVAEAPLHQAALSALQSARDAGRALRISRQVLREYLVTLTRPQSFAAVPRAIVLEQVRLFVERFQVADDTESVTAKLLDLMAETPGGGKHVHDVNIVATMLVYGVPALLTHNEKDFKHCEDRIRIEVIDT